MENKLGLYRFYHDYGRSGTLEGLFLANADDVDVAIGDTAYLGEVLGKHSDVVVTLNGNNIIFITDDEEVVNMIENFELICGINPLDYIEDYTEDD